MAEHEQMFAGSALVAGSLTISNIPTTFGDAKHAFHKVSESDDGAVFNEGEIVAFESGTVALVPRALKTIDGASVDKVLTAFKGTKLRKVVLEVGQPIQVTVEGGK